MMSQIKLFLNRSQIRQLSNFVAPTKPQPLCYFTEDEISFRDAAAKFAKEKIAPLVRKMEKGHSLDPSLREEMFKSGLFGMLIPEKYGGVEASHMGYMLAKEEISKVDPAVSIFLTTHNVMVSSLINDVGSPEQKSRYLPQLATNKIGSFCLSEPSSGSDAFAMKTVAKQDGNDFVINGSKMWISSANEADIFAVFVNADPSKGYKGVSAFIMEKSFPGLTVGPPENKLGMHASGTCPLYFENVRVPKTAVLGELYNGYQYAAKILNISRLCAAAQSLGICQGCLDLTIAYTLERKQFGSAIFDFQGMHHQIAEMATYLECARILIHNATRMHEAGLPIAKESSMAKYYASELAQKLTSKCIDWMGGVGFTKSFLQEKFYRDCKVTTIYEGTSNIQLNNIAKCLKKEYSR